MSQSSKTKTSGWAHLPTELLKMIADNLLVPVDNACFASVCTSWRSVAKTIRIPPQLPWLMLPTTQQAQGSDRREFFSLSDKRICRPRLADGKGKRCFGLNHGCWILAVGDPDVSLLNPLTGAKIPLPPLTAIPNVHRFDALISRAVLSSDPTSSNDWVLMVFFASARKFAICRGGDEAWTAVPGSCDRFKSMAYCNGKFYAVTGTWDLLVCDTSTSPPETTVIWKLRGPTPPRFYLLEFPPTDNLLLVTRGSKLGNAGDSEFFSLFMLNWGGPLPEWSRIDSIGDWVLFLSNNHSFALPASEYAGCKPNCIYYGDPFYNFQELNVNEADHNIGVYSIEKESVQLIPCLLRNTGDWELASWVRHVH